MKGADIRNDPLKDVLEKHIRSAKSGIEDTPEGKVFLTVHVPSPKLVITGAVHISQTLAPMGQLLGYDVTIVDPRTAFASIERFPDVKVIAEWPDVALPPIGIDHYTAFVALTHDPKIDDPGLDIALKSDCFYIGALGSRKTHARRVERLKAERGFTDNDIGRIHSPIGLDIGSVSPAEIAVAIIGEITQTLRQEPHERHERAAMKFGPVPPREAEGATAVHTIRQGALVLKKGTLIGAGGGCGAGGGRHQGRGGGAARAGRRVRGQGRGRDRQGGGRAGRARRSRLHRPRQSVRGSAPACWWSTRTAIDRLNRVDEAITFATLPAFKPVVEGEMIATVKIIPFATSEASLQGGAGGRRQAVHPRRALQDQEGRRGLDAAAGPRRPRWSRRRLRVTRGASGAGRRHASSPSAACRTSRARSPRRSTRC